MGILSRIRGKSRSDVRDASRVYNRLMAQSRQAAFYGDNKMPDSYDGRVEMLSLHVSLMMKALGAHRDTGAQLSQAVFDAMVDDFDIALREEGLTDSGVKRRIKPIIALFYARLKAFTEADDLETLQSVIEHGEAKKIEGEAISAFSKKMAVYAQAYSEDLSSRSISDLAQARFEFPDF